MSQIPAKYHRMFLSAILIMGCTMLLSQHVVGTEAAKNEESVRVTILQSKPVGISPDSVTINKGSTIVWVNKDPEPVKIKFKQALGLACTVPVNFYADLLGNYETSMIPQGSTASICLIHSGIYDYEVRRLVKKGTKEPYEEISDGRIIVK